MWFCKKSKLNIPISWRLRELWVQALVMDQESVLGQVLVQVSVMALRRRLQQLENQTVQCRLHTPLQRQCW